MNNFEELREPSIRDALVEDIYKAATGKPHRQSAEFAAAAAEIFFNFRNLAFTHSATALNAGLVDNIRAPYMLGGAVAWTGLAVQSGFASPLRTLAIGIIGGLHLSTFSGAPANNEYKEKYRATVSRFYADPLPDTFFEAGFKKAMNEILSKIGEKKIFRGTWLFHRGDLATPMLEKLGERLPGDPKLEDMPDVDIFHRHAKETGRKLPEVPFGRIWRDYPTIKPAG